MAKKVQQQQRHSSVEVAAALVLAAALLLGMSSSCAAKPDPQTIEIVVPAGTQARMDAGETVTVMPTRLELRVGDTLHMINNDVVAHPIGPYVVEANDELRMRYGSPGHFEGYCPLSEGERYEIIVTD